MRVTRAAISVVDDAWLAGEIDDAAHGPIPRAVRADLADLRAGLDLSAPDEVMARALLAWTGLFGHLSYELFGHLHGGVTDYDALFEVQARAWARLIARGA
jgi:hypothetical protein